MNNEHENEQIPQPDHQIGQNTSEEDISREKECADFSTASDESLSEKDPTEEKSTSGQEGPKVPFVSLILDALQLVAISLAIVMLLLTVFARHSPVYGSSMYPTIHGKEDYLPKDQNGKDVLLISNFLYRPKIGDIVVLQTPNVKGSVEASLAHPIVKRIIATGGDRVSIDFENWRIEINGKVLEDGKHSVSYVNYTEGAMNGFSGDVAYDLASSPECDYKIQDDLHEFTVPEGKIFVLGDNRNNSRDSRSLGFMDERWIVGQSLMRIYPFDRMGKVQ